MRIPDHQIDKELWQKLRAELPGILNWSVEGCSKWQKDGLEAPKDVREAVSTYREEMDTVTRFIDDCCEKDPDAKEGATVLYEAFKRWCADNAEEHPYLSQKAFGMRLGKAEFTSARSEHGNQWKGLRLIAKPMPVPADPESWRDVNLNDIPVEQASAS